MTTTTIVTMPVTKQDPLWKKVLKNPMGVISAGWVLLVVLAGIFAPIITPWDPNKADIYSLLLDPTAKHIMGTDSAGRDVFARIIYGTQTSLETAAWAIILAIFIGVLAGLIAGYFAGWFDTVSNWLTSLVMALPGLVVLLAAATVVGNSLWIGMSIFGVLLSPAYFRLVYTTVKSVKNELFVDAARVSG
ncbi:MAG: hypothetical protein RLZZ603_1241, partial [Actinomycetota bacterium]